MEEEFKTIPGCDNYEISAYGVVRNKNTGKIITPRYQTNKDKKYSTICIISNERKKVQRGIYHFVGITWLDNPNNYPYIVQKNKDPHNNHVSNLMWSLAKRSIVTNTGKVCSICKEFKDLDYFDTDITMPSGYYSSCRECANRTKRNIVKYDILCNDEYRAIPNYSKYAISNDGTIVVLKTSQLRKPSIVKGIPKHCLTDDSGKHTNRRLIDLLCESFIPKEDGLPYIYYSGDISNHSININKLHWSLSKDFYATHYGRECLCCGKMLPWEMFKIKNGCINDRGAYCRECLSKEFVGQDDTCYLYWIHRPHHIDITTEGYIGITNNIPKRWNEHRNNPNYKINKAKKKCNDLEYDILCIGTTKYIMDLEFKLRPVGNIGWNIAAGGSTPPINISLKEEQKQKMAENLAKLSRIEILNLWYDYYENGMNSYELSNKYNIYRTAVSRYIRGDAFVFKNLEDTRLAFKANQKPNNGKRRRSVSEELYNKILNAREFDKLTYVEIGDKFNLSDSQVRAVCHGKCEYIKKFKSFRVI